MDGIISTNNIKIQKEEIETYDFFEMTKIPENTFSCCKEKINILINYIEKRNNSFIDKTRTKES